MNLEKILCVPSVLFLSLLAGASTLQAQNCPYTVTATNYGSPCSAISPAPPTLLGNPISECDVMFFYDVPPLPGTVVLTHRWLAAGVMQTSVPLPGGGCPLLASLNLFVFLGSDEGTYGLQLLLPPNPALVGMSIFVQGIDRRFDPVSGARYFETTNGVRLDIL